jgi:hypothetical protein
MGSGTEEIVEDDKYGKHEYLKACDALKVVPLSQVNDAYNLIKVTFPSIHTSLPATGRGVSPASPSTLGWERGAVGGRVSVGWVALQTLKYLELEGIHLTHYGMGYRGLCALAAALKVRAKRFLSRGRCRQRRRGWGS